MKRLRFLPALAAAGLAAGCAPLPAPEASGDGGGGVRMLSLSPERAEVEAGGRRVVVAPPFGSCLVEDAAQATPGAAFLMISGCDGETLSPLLQTVSVGDGALFADEGGAGLAALERYLRSPEGLRELGMGGGAGDVSILRMRRADEALFVLVEDRSDARLPLAGDQFWRVFSELNGRIVVLSLASPEGTDATPEQALARAEALVHALYAANGETRTRVGDQPFAAPDPPTRPAGRRGS